MCEYGPGQCSLQVAKLFIIKKVIFEIKEKDTKNLMKQI